MMKKLEMKFSLWQWIALAGLGFLLPACKAQPTGQVENVNFDRTLSAMLNEENVPFMSVATLKNRSVDSVILLDAREKEEYETSHIPGAIWVGYDDFNAERVQDIERGKEVVVYCSVGYRSEKVGEQLLKMGFEDVHNLYGSIFEWANQSQPLVSPEGDTVQQIHAYNLLWGQWMKNEDIKKKY
jgi:rhodanese-related sulfurtransferase